MRGGPFLRTYDGVNYQEQKYLAVVSDFRLDTYEVTVGRFRNFIAAYSQDMIPEGAGRNPNNPDDFGWSTAWNSKLAAEAAWLTAGSCASFVRDGAAPPPKTWTDNPGANENLPINCVGNYLAYAFCIWDGGRLPTEAEWNYAAAGGCEQRVYPWSSPANATLIDDSYAVYCGGSCSAPQSVGSKSPKGDGKWGHADLAGNVAEWTRDWMFHFYDYKSPCSNCSNCENCADFTRVPESWYPPIVGSYQVRRGGSFAADDVGCQVAGRNGTWTGDPPYPYERSLTGIRCARNP